MHITYRNITLPLEGKPEVHTQIRAPFERSAVKYIVRVDIGGKVYMLEQEIIDTVPTMAAMATKAVGDAPIYLPDGNDEAYTVCLYHAIASYIHENTAEDEHVWAVYLNGFRRYTPEDIKTFIPAAVLLGMKSFTDFLRNLYRAKTGLESE